MTRSGGRSGAQNAVAARELLAARAHVGEDEHDRWLLGEDCRDEAQGRASGHEATHHALVPRVFLEAVGPSGLDDRRRGRDLRSIYHILIDAWNAVQITASLYIQITASL